MNKLFNLVIIVSIQLSAAEGLPDSESFNIEEYNPPTYKYHSLTFAPSIGWNQNGYSDSSQQAYKYIYDDSNGDISCYGTHTYRNHLLMNDIDIWSSAGFSDYYYRNEREDGSSPKNYSLSQNNGNISLNLNNISRLRHYTYNRWFLEFKVTPSLNNYYSPNERTSQTTIYDQNIVDSLYTNYSYSKYSSKGNDLLLTSGISIGIGRGWIKDVTAARISQLMVDAIEDNVGKRPLLSSSEMQSLASYIDKLKHRRSFDSRLSEIEDIDSLIGYMLHNGIVINEKTRLIMQIDDLWRYGFHQNRRSGMEVLFFPIVEGSYNQRKTESSNEYLDTNMKQDVYRSAANVLGIPPTSVNKNEEYRRFLDYSYGLGFNMGISRAIGRFFQFDGSFNLEGKMLTNHDLTRIQKDTINSILYERHPLGKADVSIKLNWYPETRTTVTLGNEYSYLKENNYNTIFYSEKSEYLSSDSIFNNVEKLGGTTWLSVDYYLSPKCSYSVGIGYRYSTLKSHKINFRDVYYTPIQKVNENDNGFWIDARLTYSIL